MRIAMDGMCSNESGIDSNKMFIGFVLRAALEPDRARHGLQVKLRVAEIETRRLDVFMQQVERVLLTIADGSEDLMSAARHRQARLARVGLGERRIRLGRAALRGLPRRHVQERARRIHVAYEIRAGVLDGLVAADRPRALDTRLGVL